MKNKSRSNSFAQRIGQLVEDYIINEYSLTPNRRQQTRGYYDAYNGDRIYEIKAAKDNNYFRIKQNNHKQLIYADGSYIFVRYALIDKDEELKIISDIEIESVDMIKAINLQDLSVVWLEDQRKKNLYFKVKL